MADSTVELTTDEQRRLKYFKDTKEMTAHFNDLAIFAQSCMTMALHVGALEKGQILRTYDSEDRYYEFSKKDLRATTALLVKSIKELSIYWKVSKKKPKAKIGPTSLKGTYTPIFAGEVLIEFFKQANNFGPLDVAKWKETGVLGETVMSQLPYASQGYMLRNTLTMLFFLYVRSQELQEPENGQYSHMDDHMRKVFTELPAAFYTADGVAKMPMDEAIKKGHIKAPLSTQDVIRLKAKHKNFNTEKTPILKLKPEEAHKQIYRKAYPNFFFQLLASNNYYSKKNLENDPARAEILASLVREDVSAQMVHEHNVVHEISARWNAYLAPSRKEQRDKKKKENDAKKKAEKDAQAEKTVQ
jgi:hypothetical protein